MKTLLLIAALFTTACTDTTPTEVRVCREEKTLSTNAYLLWTQPRIKVCWDHEDEVGDFYNRIMVEVAIREDWNRALSPSEVPYEEQTQISGFRQCRDTIPYDIKITIHQGVDHTKGIGKNAAGMNLNFLHKPTSQVKGDALHEFGHLLGLLHEHERFDSYDDCPPPNGISTTPSTEYYGDYDRSSIMSYCNHGRSTLSPSDVLGIRQLYYPDYFPTTCEELEL